MTLYIGSILWSLSFLIENSDDGPISKLCSMDRTLDRIIKYAQSPLEEEQNPALRILGSITSSGENANIDKFIFNDGLATLRDLLIPSQSV